MVRTPTRAMTANLRWTRSGAVWADWILTGLPYGLRPTADKRKVRALHQALFRALPGDSLLLGVRAGLDPAAIVTRMLADVDLQACPDWAAECEATLDWLDRVGPGLRLFWLSVPLAAARPSDRAMEPLRAASSDLRDRLGLPRAPIPAEEVARRLAQAARIAEGIPAPFAPAPATPAQMVWLHRHSLARGLFVDADLPAATDPLLSVVKTGAALPEAVLDEGGQSDLPARSPARLNPVNRRFLKIAGVSEPADAPASYQALTVVADVPDGGTVFPGSEVIGRIDESGLDVDWAMRLSVRSSSTVASQNARALRNLNEQYGQRAGELSHGLNMLDRVAGDLAEYVALLESDKLEVEVQTTLIFAVAGPTSEAARTQSRALADFLADTGYRLAVPLGGQEELWWAMHPGVPASRTVREFAQITTSRALAATVPLATARLGDAKGSALGLNIAHGPLLAADLPCGPTGVVLHDLEGASDRQVSGSAAVAGELGAGKALALTTPILSTCGWTTMGALLPGDRVFDETGVPTQVLAVSPVMTGHRCYQLTLSDGSTIIADAEHLWTTLSGASDEVRRPAGRAGTATLTAGPRSAVEAAVDVLWAGSGQARTWTTEQLADQLSAGIEHVIPTAGPLQKPARQLPLDPYLLGCCLALGRDPFRGAGGIPPAYLQASWRQRHDLLAWLTLTGGACSDGVERLWVPAGLAEDVMALLRSLGYLPSLHHLARDARRVLVTFPQAGTRLLDRLLTQEPHRPVPQLRRIVEVREVASVAVRCIRVAAPSRLFLAGRGLVPTHNTATLMKLAGDVIDRGGQLIIADRTAKGEWASWAAGLTRAVVVDTSAPALSLDPLRVFGPRIGNRMMQSFLTPLLNVRPSSDRGALLSEVLDPAYLERHQLDSAGALLAHLQHGCTLPGADELARLVNVFARRDLGAAIFDGSVPPLDLASRAVVIRTHTLQLPSREELEHAHLFEQLGLEKVFGRALNALIAALARQVCFADTSVLAGFVVSEAHAMTVSFEGERELAEFVRDGRKHRAVVLLDSHDPLADFGSPTLRGLIPTRILMRHRDRTLAQRGLEWLDLDPADESLVEMVRRDTSPLGPDGQEVPVHRRGEATMRDMAGNVGRVKVMLPARAERAAAITAGGSASSRSPTGRGAA